MGEAVCTEYAQIAWAAIDSGVWLIYGVNGLVN